MSLSFKSGQRVKVTMTGKVAVAGLDGGRFWFTPDGAVGSENLISPRLEGVTVERIEPEYENGRAYLDADGCTFIRTSRPGTPWVGPSGNHWDEGFPTRPLVRLVPAPE